MLSTRTLATVAASAALITPATAQQATWTEILGFGPGIDVSLDGTFVALSNNAVWDAINGPVAIAGSDSLVGIDASGTRLAGNVTDGGNFENAGYYDGVSWTALGSVSGNCDANLSSGYDISDDGNTVVGLAWDGCTARAFYWRPTSGLVALPSTGANSSRANCTNITGTVVGGWDRGDGFSNNPAIWTDLTQPPTILGGDGEVNGISADGLTYCGSDAFVAAIFRDGQPTQYIPDAPGIAPGGSVLYGCDPAGEVFVGTGGGSGPFSSPSAIYYREDVGTITIANLATELGITSPNLDLAGFAFEVSADGNTVVGGLLSPFLPFATDAWVLTLPEVFLFRDTADVSVAAGGSQGLDVYAGPSRAGDIYFVLGSASGTSPGLLLDGIAVPLNLDAYLNFLLVNPNTLISSSFGFLDGTGAATAAVNVPAGTSAALAGASVDHAAIVIDSTTFVVSAASNTQGLNLVP